jgi:hypothetical protein
MLTVYYLPRELYSVIFTAVYIPHQADTTTALKELHCTLSKLETAYPDDTFIVAWDFNKANFRKTLPKFYQHIDCGTCTPKTLNYYYSPFWDTYKALPLQFMTHKPVRLAPTTIPNSKALKSFVFIL